MSNAGFHRAGKFLLILTELCLILTVVYLFNIETLRHLFPVLCFLICGFAIHAWLPLSRESSRQSTIFETDLRLNFFSILSVACILFVLGAVNGLSVLVIGTVLIGICYLPLTLNWRLIVLLNAGAILIVLRVMYPLPFWPVVGSMFMFRIVTFVYEVRRVHGCPSLAWAMSYFFMLPNACFPLFPIVDFKTFVATRYDQDEWLIYQRGIAWIGRGLIHLLLYRAIKAYLVPEVWELHDFLRIAVFVVTNYALYLQVSGHFHLVTGVLHLFGFNLPPTHHFYFLASSFSDIWRRINIYWKDFMTKYFFYPVFYGIRGRGASVNQAMLFSVFVVFSSTWLLHSWQTFWLLGRFPVTVNDGCLWLGAGCLVAVNSLFESRRREPGPRTQLFQALGTSVRTVGMFVLVSLFWSCWTKPGFLSLIASSLNRPGAMQGILIVIMSLLVAVVLGTVILSVRNGWVRLQGSRTELDFGSSVKLHLAALSLIVAFASPGSSGLMDSETAMMISNFCGDPTTVLAAGEKLQSYYEDLNTASIQAGPLLSSFTATESKRRKQAEGFLKVSRQADLYQGIDLIPGVQTELDGQPFSVNLFGMRDRSSMTFDKPYDTYRIAFVGSSIVMGYGVSDEEVFSRQFEELLNLSRTNLSPRFQVLNFGVGKQWAPQRLVRMQRKVFAFNPDALYYFAHQDEFKELASHTAQLIYHGRELSSQHLKDVAAQAEVTSRQPPGEVLSRLTRFEPELLRACYQTIVEACNQRNAVPVWIYLPIPGEGADVLRDKLIPIASEAGFIVCDLSDWADDQTGLFPTAEFHPSARGHELIARRLLRMVRTIPEALPKYQTHDEQ